jgi:hypothetical protein
MLNKIKNNQSIEILKSCLNREIKDIYVTGWTEAREKYHYFSAMHWWYYIKFEDFLLCFESSQTRGILEFHIHPEIKCNFDIEKDDIFTITQIDKRDYSGQKIANYDLGYDFNHQLIALGIQFEDTRFVHKNNKYVFFNSLSVDGIEVGDEHNRNSFLEDTCFHMEKLD